MSNKHTLFVLILSLYTSICFAQINGSIKAKEDGKTLPLIGANVFWQGTEVGTVTDSLGNFTIDKPSGANNLVASFIGFEAQTKIIISRKGEVHFVLEPSGEELGAVDVVGKVDATSIDLRRPDLTYKIDDKELRKAACCNLSESFETNATVDVSFADAVTGTKQIEMLGLSGKYALIQRENIPFARGMNATTGFSYLPGPFVESIQLTKGLSSVMNGFESLTGQINVELYNPETAPALLFNAFANEGGRMETNAITSFKVNDKVSSAILAHYSNSPIVNDHNDDGFADMPTGDQLSLINRWQYSHDGEGWEGQFGACFVLNNKEGGEIDFLNEQGDPSERWGYQSEGERFEVFGKNGYIFDDNAYKSLGIIYNASYQQNNSQFGLKDYTGEQRSFYINTIFQNIIGSDKHNYKTGISFMYDDVSEFVNWDPSIPSAGVAIVAYARTEYIPGAYLEYTYEPNPKFTAVGGARVDYNSFFNRTYVTPRLNLKYNVSEKTTLRLAGGRGQRTSTFVFENLSALASNRDLIFSTALNDQPEVGWNTGLSLSQNFNIGHREVGFTIDGFYTWFENKLVKDADFNPTAYYFINREGSNSLSILSQLDFEILESLEMRLAYKYLNAQDNFLNGMNLSYLIPKHRTFVNFGYSTANEWKFDLTVNWFGEKRLQNTSSLPTDVRLPEFSNSFFTVNTQINKSFKNGLELFAGVDNLLNFQQDLDPILSVEDTNSPYFDTNFAWGPIFGRNIYVGLYYTLDKKD